MKTTWKIDYINKKRDYWEWLRAKKEQFEAETGVPWTYCTSYGMYVFQPTWNMRTIEMIEDEQIAQQLLLFAPTLFTAKTFLQASSELSIDLKTIIGVVFWLARSGRVVAMINRMGKAVAYHARD